MCAITAANRGRSVLVLEKSNKPGKKILMSGGGRCNFTNLHIEPQNFLSKNPHFCKSALSQYTQWDFIQWVEARQIAYHEKKLGQLFCDDSAKDILSALLADADDAKVELRTKAAVTHVETGDEYRVHTEQEEFRASTLVIATGGLSIPTLGGSGFGYELAESLDLPLVPRRAGLVPFVFTDEFGAQCKRLSGLSTAARLAVDSQSFEEPILFTHRGLSGPACLQISSYWQDGESIDMDLIPSENLENLVAERKRSHPKMLLRTLLAEYLPRNLVLELEKTFWSEKDEWPLSQWSDADLKHQARRINQWRLKPAGTEGYRTAEVTLGGVDTSALSSKTMEAKNNPGLFFVGEVVDVTGHLGGYNFQWAWSSGYVAGVSI